LHLIEYVFILVRMKPTWRIEEEWLEWYRMTPEQRWLENGKLWQFYISSGGSLDPEPDSQSPFDTFYSPGKSSVDGRTGMHSVRRLRIQS